MGIAALLLHPSYEMVRTRNSEAHFSPIHEMVRTRNSEAHFSPIHEMVRTRNSEAHFSPIHEMVRTRNSEAHFSPIHEMVRTRNSEAHFSPIHEMVRTRNSEAHFGPDAPAAKRGTLAAARAGESGWKKRARWVKRHAWLAPGFPGRFTQRSQLNLPFLPQVRPCTWIEEQHAAQGDDGAKHHVEQTNTQ